MANEPKVTRKRRVEEETVEHGDTGLDEANTVHEEEVVIVENEIEDDDDTIIIEQ